MTEKKNQVAVLYLANSSQVNASKTGIGAAGYIYDDRDVKTTTPINLTIESSFEKCIVEVNQETKSMLVGSPHLFLDYFSSSDVIYATPLTAVLVSFNEVLLRLLKESIIDEVGTISVYTRNTWLAKFITTKPTNSTVPAEIEATTRGILDELSNKNITLKITVSHDHFGITQANMLALVAYNLAVSDSIGEYFTLDSKKEYRRAVVARHPFMGFKRVYFNSQKELNTVGQYFLSDPGIKDTLIGNRCPETSFAVVKLNQGDPLVELVKKKQIDIAQHTNLISVIDVDKIYSKDLPFFLMEFGEESLVKNDKLFNIEFVDRQPVCVEMNPSRLSPRALDAFNFLENIIMHITGSNCQSNEVSNLQLENITSVFYNPTQKEGYELKKDMVVGFKNISITIDRKNKDGKIYSISIPLILGLDTPSRNHMKRLETLMPTVNLVTWDASENCVRYCVFIQCVDGVGVWSNYFSDRIFLNVSKK